jgi:hypothetical protein
MVFRRDLRRLPCAAWLDDQKSLHGPFNLTAYKNGKAADTNGCFDVLHLNAAGIEG